MSSPTEGMDPGLCIMYAVDAANSTQETEGELMNADTNVAMSLGNANLLLTQNWHTDLVGGSYTDSSGTQWDSYADYLKSLPLDSSGQREAPAQPSPPGGYNPGAADKSPPYLEWVEYRTYCLNHCDGTDIKDNKAYSDDQNNLKTAATEQQQASYTSQSQENESQSTGKSAEDQASQDGQNIQGSQTLTDTANSFGSYLANLFQQTF